jgi:DNA processing protein
LDLHAAVDALVLRSAAGVGDRGFRRLVDAFGCAGAALSASREELSSRCGATELLCDALERAQLNRSRCAADAERAVASGFSLFPYGDPRYPRLLAQIPDPPAVLYVAGSVRAADQRTVAVVGSRRASSQGVRFTRALARELAVAGVTVVSGLAQGIDAAAHEGALEGGGQTLAVFGAGLDVIYPGWNANLARAVRARGAWLSELPLGAEPRSHHFPRRNRIISGLCRGVVVVEAAERSGSLITATCALEQGREVFAVPGLPGSYNARGTHRLLRAGAVLVESAQDVLGELFPGDPRGMAPEAPREPAPPPTHGELWAALEESPLHIDDVAERAGVGAAQAAVGLMELSLGGWAQEWPGKRYSRIAGARESR